MRSFVKILAPSILVAFSLFLNGCEKKQGAVYIRVINRTGQNAEILVKDQEKEIPADGKFHTATGYVESRYILKNVVWDSVVNWKTNLSG